MQRLSLALMIQYPYPEDMHTDHTPQAVDTPQALAEAVAADGFDAHMLAVAELVAEARRVGVCELLAAVSLDRDQPIVVRERAFGRLVVAYYDRLANAVATVTADAGPASERFTVAA
jgi:hypothetical protein